jgi:hypothetical protein
VKLHFPASWRRFLADPRLHQFLWFCVPGLAVGLIVRAWLTVAMPDGYYHPDTHDFMTTVYFLEVHHHFTVHGKTTFLTPVLYTIPFLLHIPALLLIPLGQHLRGLLLILMMGALARLWFSFWRWLIIPLTVLAAVQPAMLFWEHTLMSESGFVFCAVALALAGTCFALWPSWWTFGGVLTAMFFVAAARPEGNLLLATGVLWPAFVEWRRWRPALAKIAAAAALMLVMLSITKTSHSGLLLYASLVHLTPDNPRTAPGLGPYIRPLRDQMRADRAEKVSNDVVHTAKRISAVLIDYAQTHPQALTGLPPARRAQGAEEDAGDPAAEAELDLRTGTNMSALCRRLAMECALAHPWQLPRLAVDKFLAPINEDSGGVFTEKTFHAKQAQSLIGKPKISAALGPGLIGSPLDNPLQARAFVNAHYHLDSVAWFNTLEAGWQKAVNYLHLPPSAYSATYTSPGLPLYYLGALAGALLALFRPARLRSFQWAFLPVLGGLWFLVMLTAAVIPRHRFVLEPFWLLYLFGLLDALLGAAGPSRRGKRDPTEATAAIPGPPDWPPQPPTPPAPPASANAAGSLPATPASDPPPARTPSTLPPACCRLRPDSTRALA